LAKFSIILPVKNGGEYVKLCVTSILSQSVQDLKLHVLDNCSNDGTAEWITSLRDPRIELHLAKQPLTIEENWTRAATISKNDFMTLIGHDDILDRNYLEVIDKLIHKNPDASLYTTHFRFINAKGKFIRNCKAIPEIQTSSGFLSSILEGNLDITGTGYVMRSADYDNCGGIPPYPNLLFADFEIWLNLAGKKHIAAAHENCFAFRLHQSTTSESADIKLQHAFQQFVGFLAYLKGSDEEMKKVIEERAAGFLSKYSTSFSHRLLRTPFKKRHGLSVQHVIDNFIGYADALGVRDQYRPEDIKTLQLALRIDKSPLLRKIFLNFKKIWKKPILH